MAGSSGSSGGTTRRSSAKPVTARDKALSKKHLRESIQFNRKHAQEHMKAMKQDQKALRGQRGNG